jgi:hypothetical protein
MRRTAVLLALVGALAPACRSQDNTKIVVAVWTDLAVPDDLDSVRIDVAGTGSKTLAITVAGQSGQATLVAKLQLVPLGAKNETFTVTATGLRSGNEVVAQTARVSFVPGQSLLLKLFLYGNCRDAKCPTDYTCAAGACDQPIAIPNLPAYDPSQPLSPPDAGTALDSGSGALDSGGDSLDSGTREAGNPDLRAVDAKLADVGTDAASDLRVPTGGAGGASGLDSASGTGGVAGSDARPIDASVADAVDAPLGGGGGVGGSSGTGGSQGTGGAGAAGSGGTVASGGVVASGVGRIPRGHAAGGPVRGGALA